MNRMKISGIKKVALHHVTIGQPRCYLTGLDPKSVTIRPFTSNTMQAIAWTAHNGYYYKPGIAVCITHKL